MTEVTNVSDHFFPMPEYNSSRDGSTLILTVSGRIDAQAGSGLREAIDGLIEGAEASDMVVDLGGVDYMASAGFRELFLAGRNLSRKGGRLAVCALGDELRRLFDLARFETAYPIFESRRDALDFFDSPEGE